MTHRDVFLASWLILWHLDDKPVLLLSTVCLPRWIQPLSGTQSSLPQAVSQWTAPRHRCVVIALASLSSGIPHQGCVVPNTHPTWDHRGKELKWPWLYRPSPHMLRLSVCTQTLLLLRMAYRHVNQVFHWGVCSAPTANILSSAAPSWILYFCWFPVRVLQVRRAAASSLSSEQQNSFRSRPNGFFIDHAREWREATLPICWRSLTC